MGLKIKKVLGIDVTISSKSDILEEVQKYLLQIRNPKSEIRKNSIKPLIIFTPNPEIITYAQKDNSFRQIVNSAQINIPDGWGISWALGKMYGIDIPKVSGVDFVADLCKLSVKNGFAVGLIGGRDGVAVQTRECLRQSYNNLKVEVFPEPEIEIQNSKFKILSQRLISLGLKNYNLKLKIKQESDKDTSEEKSGNSYFMSLANKIKQKKTDIVFVALGCPKQEIFIKMLRDQICGQDTSGGVLSLSKDSSEVEVSNKPIVFMSVGGSFDYISGRVPRAGEWMRNRGWEWLFRLIREPKRLVRQLKGVEFFYKIMRGK